MTPPAGLSDEQWEHIKAEAAAMPALTPEQQTTVSLCVKPPASTGEAA